MSLASVAARLPYAENLPTTETLEQVQRELASACGRRFGTSSCLLGARIIVTEKGWNHGTSKEVA